MKKLSEATLTETLPARLLEDKKISALAAALDLELQRLTLAAREAMHLPRLDELSGQVLDLLAWQMHVDAPYFEPLFLSDKVKRNLIRESISVHRQKGTRAAIEKVNAAFGREVKIEEFFEYGGLPYHFRIKTRPFNNPSDQAAWLRQLDDAKNVRSWYDVQFEARIETPLYIGTARWRHGTKRRLMSSAYEAGRVETVIKDGERTLIISASEVIIRYPDKEDEIIVLEETGTRDLLKMRFTFPNSERILTVENPREDVTPEEVQEFTDFVTEHEILLDEEGATEGEIRRATLVTTTVQILF